MIPATFSCSDSVAYDLFVIAVTAEIRSVVYASVANNGDVVRNLYVAQGTELDYGDDVGICVAFSERFRWRRAFVI